MAKQIITLLTDDIDGGEADTTVEFALDGVGYTIDLSESNAQALREHLSRYVDAGTRTGRVASNGWTPGQTARRTGVDNPAFKQNKSLNAKIRAWALANGYPISERGRIPQHVVNSYYKGVPNPAVMASGPDLFTPEPELAQATPAAEPTPSTPATKSTPAKTTPAKATRSRAKATT